MNYTYLSYFGIAITIIINLIYYIFKNKLKNNEIPNTILLNKFIKISNYLIFLNILITIIGIILKLNNVIIHTFDDFLIVMYFNAILIITSSIIGLIACIYNLFKIRKENRDLMSQAPQKAKFRFFAQFALFVFGITWAFTDSIFTFDWTDYITRLLLNEPLQYIPIEGVIYIVLIYLIPNFKLFDIFRFKLPFRRKNY